FDNGQHIPGLALVDFLWFYQDVQYLDRGSLSGDHLLNDSHYRTYDNPSTIPVDRTHIWIAHYSRYVAGGFIRRFNDVCGNRAGSYFGVYGSRFYHLQLIDRRQRQYL